MEHAPRIHPVTIKIFYFRYDEKNNLKNTEYKISKAKEMFSKVNNLLKIT